MEPRAPGATPLRAAAWRQRLGDAHTGNEFPLQDTGLADLLLAPIMGYVSITPQAEPLLGEAPALKRWWEAVSERPSFRDTPLKWSRIPSDAGAMPL